MRWRVPRPTVGFHTLSDLARALEHAMWQAQGTIGWVACARPGPLWLRPKRCAGCCTSLPPASSRTLIPRCGDDEDDIDLADAIDPDLFPDLFEEEAIELMPQLGGALRQWAARPDNRGARDEVLRALHTLKGSARLAGALRMGEMAHRMESEIEHWVPTLPGMQHAERAWSRFAAPL
jgi:hypothetical protein